jgi:hypothetical protein
MKRKFTNLANTVFYKSNACLSHPFSISSILRRDVLSEEENDRMKNDIWLIVSELYFPPVRANGRFRNCLCNGSLENPTGGSRTLGCGIGKGCQGRCKFWRRPVKKPGRFCFSLNNPAKSNSVLLEAVCHKAADICSKETCLLTPEAAAIMLSTGKFAQECRVGLEQPKIYAGVTFVSDYTAHGHYDSNDHPLGVTGLLSMKDRLGEQLHCLNEYSLEEGGEPGVAFDLGNASVLIEAASRELHSSSQIKNPDCKKPSRVGLVCYQHNHLDKPDHGSKEEESLM